MRIRQIKRDVYAETPRAGKKRSLHSSADGLKLPEKRRNSYNAPTHDHNRVLGWKYFDKK